MAKPTLEEARVSVVCLGSFNPQILQPAWFAAHQLLSEKESETAEIRIIHAEVVSFEVDWLVLEVTRERLVATSTQEPYEPLKDLIVGVLTLLSHTPIRAMGFNLERHYRMPSEEVWHDLGHRLAPPSNWEAILSEPGMRTLVMEGQRTDSRPGVVRIQVEPSILVVPGVFVAINDHFENGEGESAKIRGASWAVNLLQNEWIKSMVRSDEQIEHVVGIS